MTAHFHWSTGPLAQLLRLITTSPAGYAGWIWSSLWSSEPQFKMGYSNRLDNHGDLVTPNRAITPGAVKNILQRAGEVISRIDVEKP